jgi:uncharacterized Zn-binding protein involved in type VI secretion
MFPAARVLDPITHDMLVPCGVIGPSVTCPCAMLVMIEMLPAAHVSHVAICTGVITGGIIHPPLPPSPPAPPNIIVKGSTTVFIHGMPAARWAVAPDMAACGVFLGNPALIATRKVFIGG